MKKLTALILLVVSILGIGLFAEVRRATGNLTADGNTDLELYAGERYAIGFSNDFGGGTITINYLVGTTYVTFDNGTFTDDGGIEFVMPSRSTSANENFRITLAGATSPDIDYSVTQIQ